MRIDPNHQPEALPQSGRNGTQTPAAAGTSDSSISNLLSQDQAQLSGTHAQIQALAAQAAQMPEVRQVRVQALRQAVESGSYHPGAYKVAAALFSDMMIEPAV